MFSHDGSQAAHCVLAQNPENIELARFYCFTQKTISKRLVLRQDPSVKRTVCKKCCALLIPGVTSTVRQKNAGPSSKSTTQEEKNDIGSMSTIAKTSSTAQTNLIKPS
ncbi:hypothetical protein cypCar_00040862 [Cyprinus carpio]|nr:hypothetical protein cypCar_00040862 [Cyprinus carpio]